MIEKVAALFGLLASAAAVAAVAGADPRSTTTAGDHVEIHNPLSRLNVAAMTVDPDPNVVFETNVTELQRSGEWVEVTIHGVSRPRSNDLIAVYVPADADPKLTAPVKFRSPADDRQYFRTGAATVRFQLFNHRANMRFVLLRGTWDIPRVGAWGPVIEVANVNEPLQGHLHLTGDNTEMLVQWVTKDRGNPVVQWGTSPGKYDNSAVAKSITYTKDELCGGQATTYGWIDPGLFHIAVMTGLVPGRRYFYVYGDEDFGFSKESNFLAAPPVGPDTSVKLLSIADLGQAEEDSSTEPFQFEASLMTTKWLKLEESTNQDYQLLMHNGDISYAMGYVAQWDHYFEQLGPVVQKMPYMTSIGNHERDWPASGDRYHTIYDSGGECGVAYEKRCYMPLKSKGDAWYSFDFGPIHFLQYSTEHDFDIGSQQYKFIEDDLKSVNRSKTPWLIMGGHRPIYIDSTYDGWPAGDITVSAALMTSLEPLLYKYKVDLTWHGHHHSYQRTCPVYRQKCLGYSNDGVARAPVHMVIGHAGAELSYNIHTVQPSYFEKVVVDHGYSRVFVNGTHLHMDIFYDYDRSLMDTVTLYKPKDWENAWNIDQPDLRTKILTDVISPDSASETQRFPVQ